MMRPDQIKVGATYRFDGQMRSLKRVLQYTLGGFPGGRVKLVGIKKDGSLTGTVTWRGDYFVSRVVEEINDWPDPPAPPHGKPINFWIYWAMQRIDHRAALACERIRRAAA